MWTIGDRVFWETANHRFRLSGMVVGHIPAGVHPSEAEPQLRRVGTMRNHVTMRPVRHERVLVAVPRLNGYGVDYYAPGADRLQDRRVARE